ncbi:MAG: class I fructose-bisphosphate aldolase [Candidatus Pacebacteria bacterium]|nr:class I fructose-bisphosphate aldolase [Candidatus Paceibacterota bacterium]NCS98028.1 class I fructose-bisphosphate aldolase [Candidatus Paceibacterota bacterium]PIZ78326.1 MAG: fructose-bisphosphate aldolase [Candidatus Pacebacteria bacterium CG_4_10_14_0_2_um_filter_40_20]PJA68630.1 MAG: fructose-bisphosphate aldolase [Candidatus Pacebacteria bacterium CG_4_9_14_3_um_filter_40_12]PJC41570.1 MAG: fructose-bisphosphate aldolase [Candidatus Pacebacteria bacterium CG_4_9_14_0_2_um_filter_40_1
MLTIDHIESLLGNEANSLLSHTCERIPAEVLHHTGPNHVAEIFTDSDRSEAVMANLDRLYNTGRLAGTGYLSIFPVDQGMEHTAAYSFYNNPIYFDPENILQMAIEGGTNGVASTLGVLGLHAKRYADKIPFIVKLNHSEHLTLPENADQLMFASVEQAAALGAAGVGATIYFGSDKSHRQIVEVSRAFARAHELGLFTILWCYPRNPNYKEGETDYTNSVDVTSQAIHIGVTIQADIVKQKMPLPLHAFQALKFSKYTDEMYDILTTDNPIDLVRYQVAHSYLGKIGLINSGGESKGGEADMAEAVRSAVINKRGGGCGLIMGRKVFKKPFADGVEMLHAVQDVYLNEEITIA